jgi:hypothetical protein
MCLDNTYLYFCNCPKEDLDIHKITYYQEILLAVYMVTKSIDACKTSHKIL